MRRKRTIEYIDRVVEENRADEHLLEKELKRLVKEGQETGNVLLIGGAYYSLAGCYERLGRKDSSFSAVLKAVAFLENTEDHELTVNAINMLALSYYYQVSYQTAMEYYDRAWAILKKHRIQGKTRIHIINGRANCFHMMGDVRTSIRLRSEAIRLAYLYTPESYTDIVKYVVNQADCHKDLGDYKKAGELLVQIEDLIDKIRITDLACDYYLRRALLAYSMGDPGAGGRFVDEALRRVEGTHDAYPLYEDFREVMHHLVNLSEWERASKIIDIVKGYAERNRGTLEQFLACRTIAEYCIRTGDQAGALEYYKHVDELYEIRMKEEKKVQLNLLKRMKQSEREIGKLNRTILEKEISLSREPLTGLMNRSALIKISKEFMDTARTRKEKIGAIFIDIDYFKEYNDTYGHLEGDDIIRKVAAACHDEESDRIRFARYGGDEFFGIIRGLNDSEVTGIARRICDKIRGEKIRHEKNPNGQIVTLSVGVANMAMKKNTGTLLDIAGCADKAVYHAKNSGKNAICMFRYDQKDGDPVVCPVSAQD